MQGTQEEEFVLWPLLWKGIRWPTKNCIQLASHHHIHNISCQSYLELWIQCCGSHIASDATVWDEHTEQEQYFFSTIIQWTQIFRFPFSTQQWTPASPCITRKPQLRTALTQKRGCLPHILAMVSASWQWEASTCKATKEFCSSVLRWYLLKEMPIFEKCNLLYIIGWLLAFKLRGVPPTTLHDI